MPSFAHGKNAKVFVNGYELTSFFSSAQTSKTQDVADVSTFQSVAKTYVCGLQDDTLTLEGFYDKTAAAADPVLDPILGVADSIVSYLPEGDAIGKTGYAIKAIETSYDVQASISDAVKISAAFQSQIGGERVTSVAPLASRTGGGTLTVQDFGAGSTGAPVGYLHVTAINGGTAVIKIQDSGDNVTYADLITFANVTAANTAQRVTAAGTVRQYARVTHAVTGGTASFTVELGRSANT